MVPTKRWSRIEYTAESVTGTILATGEVHLNHHKPNVAYMQNRVSLDMGTKCLACAKYRGCVDAKEITIEWMHASQEWRPMDAPIHGFGERLRLLILPRDSESCSFLCASCLPTPKLSNSELEWMNSRKMRAEEELHAEVVAELDLLAPGSHEEHEVLDEVIDGESELENASDWYSHERAAEQSKEIKRVEDMELEALEWDRLTPAEQLQRYRALQEAEC